MIKKLSHFWKRYRYALCGISVVFLIYVAQYYLLWYQPLFCPEYERPLHPHQRSPYPLCDIHGNTLIIDAKDNMVLVISLPDGYSVYWIAIYGWTRNSTKFYPGSTTRRPVKVYRSPNTFVVIDGLTGKYLLKEPIAKDEARRWYTQLSNRNDLSENMLKRSCEEFGISDEKYASINETINSHAIDKEEKEEYEFDDENRLFKEVLQIIDGHNLKQ